MNRNICGDIIFFIMVLLAARVLRQIRKGEREDE